MFGVRRSGNQPGESQPEGGEKAAPASSDGQDNQPASPARASGDPARRFIVIGSAVALVVAGAVIYAATQGSSSSSHTASGGSQSAARAPIHVVSITPAKGATNVDGADPVTVIFSGSVAANSPHPVLQPAVPGKWTAEGNAMIFEPDTPFGPSTRVTVTVPDGSPGVRSASGGPLTATVIQHFTTASYSQLALAELLAQQGYLPMTWKPINNGATRDAQTYQSTDPAMQTPAGQAYNPPAGTFQMESGYPSALASMWSPDQPNVLLRGAVMAFESEHGMPIDGNLTPRLWRALFRAQVLDEQNKNGYTYAIASKGSPETLTIWHNGHFVMRSLANTGIPVSPTVDGTFPVYQRYVFQIMRGTNPDGSTYADPVSYVSYFNGGDAVHYFPRGSYGFEQSLGCVELPYNDAKQAYPYLTYGSLVSVVG